MYLWIKFWHYSIKFAFITSLEQWTPFNTFEKDGQLTSITWISHQVLVFLHLVTLYRKGKQNVSLIDSQYPNPIIYLTTLQGLGSPGCWQTLPCQTRDQVPVKLKLQRHALGTTTILHPWQVATRALEVQPIQSPQHLLIRIRCTKIKRCKSLERERTK